MPADEELKMMVNNPALSDWFRKALLSALECDPVNAANDAGLLSIVLDRRASELASAAASQAVIQQASKR